MPNNEKGVLDSALASTFGLSLLYPSERDAKRMRRRLYAYRAKARRINCRQYDGLCILARSSTELWIVQRTNLLTQPPAAQTIRALLPEDIAFAYPQTKKQEG